MPGAGFASALPTPCLAEGIEARRPCVLASPVRTALPPRAAARSCQLFCSSGMTAQERHHMPPHGRSPPPPDRSACPAPEEPPAWGPLQWRQSPTGCPPGSSALTAAAQPGQSADPRVCPAALMQHRVSRRLSGCALSAAGAAAVARRSRRGREPASRCPPCACWWCQRSGREASGDQRWVPLAFNSSLADPPRLLVGALVLDSFSGASGGAAIALGWLVLALFGDSAACSRVGAG